MFEFVFIKVESYVKQCVQQRQLTPKLSFMRSNDIKQVRRVTMARIAHYASCACVCVCVCVSVGRRLMAN